MSNRHDLSSLMTTVMLSFNNSDMNYSDYSYGTTYTLDTNVTSSFNDSSMTGASSTSLEIKILRRFHMIAMPVISGLGIISNVLSFCIFINKTLRRTSCCIYLAARSASDIGFLISIFIPWLEFVSVPLMHTWGVCQMVVFTSYIFGFLSVWLVVFITLENYIRICHPFSVSRFCTVQKALYVLLGLFLLSLVLYQFSLWTTHVKVNSIGKNRCDNKEQFNEIVKVLVYVDTAVTLLLPSVLILFFMVAICCSLVSSLKRQLRLKQGNKSGQTLNNHVLTTHASNGRTTTLQVDGTQRATKKKASTKRGSSPQAKVTKLLFAVSCTFFVLSLPSYVIRLRLIILSIMGKASETPGLDEKLQLFFQILYYLSFAVNLVVYLSCGESFRNVFMETYIRFFMKRRDHRRRSEISHTSCTTVRNDNLENAEKKEEETSLIS